MSKTAAVVCEGPTDFPVLEAIILDLWPDIERVLPLQPPLDELGQPTSRRGGWSEVQKWCQAHADKLTELLSGDFGDPIDLLVVALDMDIAIQAGIMNPPKQGLTPYAAKRLCNTVKGWLETETKRLPAQLVIGLPAMAVEAWIVAALFKDYKNPEKLDNPALYLAERGKLEMKDGRPWKQIFRYRRFADQVAGSLEKVRVRCFEAERLCSKIEQRRHG